MIRNPTPAKLESLVPPVSPPWAGLVAAGLVVAALALFRVPALSRVASPLMLACHALTALALVTLAQEAWRLFCFRRPLRSAALDDADAWPRQLLNRALAGRLDGLFGQVDIDHLLDEAADDTSASYARRWWPYRLLAFLPPLLGLLDGWKNVRAESNLTPLADVFLPWTVALIEAGIWLALTTWLAHDAQSTVDDWRSLAGRLVTLKSALLNGVLSGTKTVSHAGTGQDAKAYDGADRNGGADTADDRDRSDGHVAEHNGSDTKEQTQEIPEQRSLSSIFDDLFNAAGEQPGGGEIKD